MKDTMRSGANVELGLKIGNMCETNIHCIRLKERVSKPTVRSEIGAPHRAKIGTAFQDGAELLVRIQAVDDRQDHQTTLGHPIVEKERKAR